MNDLIIPNPNGEEESEALHLGRFAEQAYLAYSVSVIRGRAIPEIQDGQKPVQRRILYAMRILRLEPQGAPKKSARVVGDVIGKYHPHGDSAVYEAMVRMAQDFSLRYPLIEGQGNWGTLDGDGAAAMRYTECTLSKYSELLLSEINQGTVDFRENYDGSEQEPVILPARLPFSLLNGQSGIAVGLAMDSVPHNLAEVGRAAITVIEKSMTDTPATLTDVMTHIQGPDFPMGGQVTTDAGALQEIYSRGGGSIDVRARWHVEKLAGGDWQIVIHELPPGVSSEKVLTELEAITSPVPRKGSKSISAEQANEKTAMLQLVRGMRNGAGKGTTPIRLIVEPKGRRSDPDAIMHYLFSHTSLAARAKVNLTFIGLDGAPHQHSLLECLQAWSQFREHTVRRRTSHRLSEVDRRIHLLEGRQAILIDIDKAIAIIRDSESVAEAKARLIAAFTLSEAQADDVLALRLRQLTKLDAIAIEKELGDLRKEQKALNHLLKNREALLRQIISEIESDIEEYGDPRRTLIEEAQSVQAPSIQQLTDEPVTIIVSRKGWARSRNGHAFDISNLSFKPGDSLLQVVETRSSMPLVLLDSRGRVYTVSPAQIPGGRGDGIPLSSLIEVQDKAGFVAVLTGKASDSYLIAGSKGYGFRVRLEDMLGRTRKGKPLINLQADESPLKPVRIAEDSRVAAMLSSAGFLAVCELSEINELAKGKGVKLMALKPEETLHYVDVDREGLLSLPTRRQRPVTLQGPEFGEYLCPRARRGKKAPRGVKP